MEIIDLSFINKLTILPKMELVGLQRLKPKTAFCHLNTKDPISGVGDCNCVCDCNCDCVCDCNCDCYDCEDCQDCRDCDDCDCPDCGDCPEPDCDCADCVCNNYNCDCPEDE